MTKKQIKVEVDSIGIYHLDGYLKDAVSMFSEMLDKVPNEYKDTCEIESVIGTEYDCPYCRIEIYYHRPETEVEEAERLEKEAMRAEKSIADKRAKLEQLKRELGED